MTAYDLHGILAFHLPEKPTALPEVLARRLAPYRIEKPAPGSMALHLGKIPEQQDGHRCSGRYKSIPWRSLVLSDAEGAVQEVWFEAPWFRTFLLFRFFLLPALWRAAVGRGGFYLLGTAYREAGITHLLFAPPGAGKTSRLLRQLAEKSDMELIGDGSLLFLPDRGMVSVLPEIELRYATVRNTRFWGALHWRARWRLQYCRWVSALTRRRISFNITVAPEEFGCRVGADQLRCRHVFEKITDGIVTTPPPECAEAEILAYLRQYLRSYTYIFPESAPLAETEANFRRFRALFFPAQP